MTDALKTSLQLEYAQLPDAPVRAHALVRLEADGRPDLKRPPLDLVACIDVSGSMSGRKLEEVKKALLALAGELGANDRLGVTAFETEVARVLPPTRMNATGKQRLTAAVTALGPMGSTNLSGGVLGAVSDLEAASAPGPDAVRRVLLFTDGHANVGVQEGDREAWTNLVRERLSAVSVSWFGFGEDHDAEFLSFLADLTRGNAYVARDEDAITDAFAQELGGLLGVRAMDIEVELSLTGGRARLLNDERSEWRDGVLRIQLDDLSCEERKDLVVELELERSTAAFLDVGVVVRWRDAVTSARQESALKQTFAMGARRLGEANAEVREAMALVFAANAQKQARGFAEAGRWGDAVQTIEAAIRRLLELDSERSKALARHLANFLGDYADAASYRGSRSKLRSAERAMSKQRSTGSELDELFMGSMKRDLQARFKDRTGPEGLDPKLVQQLKDELAGLFRPAKRRSR
jgi:Mg-chelatase subunit ChlD